MLSSGYSIKAIIAVVIYIIILFIIYFQMKARKNVANLSSKVPITYIIIVSLCCTILNIYVSFGKSITGGDRGNYLQDFNGRQTGYLGFDAYLDLARFFTDDFYKVLYATTFICCVLMLISCFISLDSVSASSTAMVLFCTPFLLNTFINLKQCYACAFASLMFAILSYPQSIKRDLSCIACLLLACSFHTTGYLLIPIYLILRYSKKINFKVALALIIIVVAFLQPFSLFLSKQLSGILPTLSYKLNEYFMEESQHESDGSSIVFLKGIPYYIATIIGFCNRKNGKVNDEKYDVYLLILSIGTFSYMCSIVSYWLVRLIAILYFPISIAIYKVITAEKNPKGKLIEYIVIVGGILFFTLRSLALNIINYGGY